MPLIHTTQQALYLLCELGVLQGMLQGSSCCPELKGHHRS